MLPAPIASLLLWSALWTLLFEGVTLAFRFGLRIQMRTRAGRFARLTFGMRVHHGFTGLLLLGVAPWLGSALAPHAAAIALGLVLSDALHHFAVLYPLTGDHEFHVVADARPPARVLDELATLSDAGVWAYGLFHGLLLECATVYCRFGLGWQSRRELAVVWDSLGGLRIHHGYIGLVGLLAALSVRDRRAKVALRVVGTALVSSDLAHHFLVLWPLTGDAGI